MGKRKKNRLRDEETKYKRNGVHFNCSSNMENFEVHKEVPEYSSDEKMSFQLLLFL